MFKIEVQADSIPQLADRLLALGAQLSAKATPRVTFDDAEAAEPEQPAKRTRAPNKPKPEPEVAAVQAEQQAEPQTESLAEEAEATAEPESGVVAADLDFDKDVAPRVLDLVARKGREAMVKVLDEFGAARASEVDAAQWPELIAKLAEAGA